ncbi:MAG: hypothetical protein Harvfovirus12_30, partial [Harvfovirus sp.]
NLSNDEDKKKCFDVLARFVPWGTVSSTIQSFCRSKIPDVSPAYSKKPERSHDQLTYEKFSDEQN